MHDLVDTVESRNIILLLYTISNYVEDYCLESYMICVQYSKNKHGQIEYWDNTIFEKSLFCIIVDKRYTTGTKVSIIGRDKQPGI